MIVVRILAFISFMLSAFNFRGDEDWIVVLNGSDEEGVAEEIARKLAVCDFSTHFDHANNRLVYICVHA